jgi:hypothetical protein
MEAGIINMPAGRSSNIAPPTVIFVGISMRILKQK